MVEVGTNGTISPPVGGVLRGAQRAEQRGYDSLWWPDHLMGFHPDALWRPEITSLAEAMPNPHVFVDAIAAMSACAVHTDRIRLGTAVTEVFRRHPAMLAQEFLTIDHFSSGRAILGLGAGEGENVEPYGMSFDQPVSRLAEALEVIRLLWESDGPVDFDGQHFSLRDAVLGLEPYRPEPDGPPHYPPIWLGAHGPRMLRLTGTKADGWLPIYQGGLERWKAGLSAIREASTSAGRSDAVIAGLLAHVIIANDESELERLLSAPLIRIWMLTLPAWCYEQLGLEHPLGGDAYGLLDYIPTRLSERDVERALDLIPPEVPRRFLVCGTYDQVAEELETFIAAGLEHVVLWNLTYLADAALLRDSFAAIDELAQTLR